ncbi:hypothetical protein [Falsiroseomonas sp. E2-1-a20]|uniref:hypothetical protein n=1 Tax=Falsiroseomonas sp. E2-1-a20 TaxID=3239300 RepID=UPI003F31F6B6
MLRVFGGLAPRVATLIRTRPQIVVRLINAPREAVHAIAAFLFLAPESQGADDEVAALIYDMDPRDLLRTALPTCPPSLYRALDHAGDRVHPCTFYERLGALCQSPYATALLKGNTIDDARLRFFERLAQMDPALSDIAESLDERGHLAEAADSMVALLRARGALRDDDLELPPRAGVRAITRRLRAALSRIEAPDPGFLAPPPFRFVRNTDELQRIGRTFGNCVAVPQWNAARQHVNLIQGTSAFLISDHPPMLASLHRFADRVWQVDQVLGPKNEVAPTGTHAALTRALRERGLTVVTSDPHTSLARLTDAAGRRSRLAVEFDRIVELEDYEDEEPALRP